MAEPTSGRPAHSPGGAMAYHKDSYMPIYLGIPVPPPPPPPPPTDPSSPGYNWWRWHWLPYVHITNYFVSSASTIGSGEDKIWTFNTTDAYMETGMTSGYPVMSYGYRMPYVSHERKEEPALLHGGDSFLFSSYLPDDNSEGNFAFTVNLQMLGQTYSLIDIFGMSTGIEFQYFPVFRIITRGGYIQTVVDGTVGLWRKRG